MKYSNQKKGRKRERELRYVKTGAARLTIGHRISNRLDSSYLCKEEGEKYLTLKERKKIKMENR